MSYVLLGPTNNQMYSATVDAVPKFVRMRHYAAALDEPLLSQVKRHVESLTGRTLTIVHYDKAPTR